MSLTAFDDEIATERLIIIKVKANSALMKKYDLRGFDNHYYDKFTQVIKITVTQCDGDAILLNFIMHLSTPLNNQILIIFLYINLLFT